MRYGLIGSIILHIVIFELVIFNFMGRNDDTPAPPPVPVSVEIMSPKDYSERQAGKIEGRAEMPAPPAEVKAPEATASAKKEVIEPTPAPKPAEKQALAHRRRQPPLPQPPPAPAPAPKPVEQAKTEPKPEKPIEKAAPKKVVKKEEAPKPKPKPETPEDQVRSGQDRRRGENGRGRGAASLCGAVHGGQAVQDLCGPAKRRVEPRPAGAPVRRMEPVPALASGQFLAGSSHGRSERARGHERGNLRRRHSKPYRAGLDLADWPAIG